MARLWQWLTNPVFGVLQLGPPVILVSDRDLYANLALSRALRRLGYRSVEREIPCLATRYVRTLPLWLAHRMGIGLFRAFWGTLHKLYDWKFVQVVTPPGVQPRLRDFRPSLPRKRSI